MSDWIVTDRETGLSALDFLRQRLPTAPAGYLRQLLRKGRVEGNGQPLAVTAPVRRGDRVSLPNSQRLQSLIALAATDAAILCETRDALIVDKPAGLAVHRGVGHEKDHLVGRVDRLLQNRGLTFRCAPVHRLDAGTSGPVLFGKGRRAIAAFGKVFMQQPVAKIYLALVTGTMPEAGHLEAPVPVRGRARPALTTFRRLGGSEGHTFLELQLQTGRRHQIRHQLAAAGHPVVGDERYGGSDLEGLARLFLHCRLLEVPDPFSGKILSGRSALPPSLVSALERLDIEPPAP
jgi:RluA family pseudouridine synthase